MARVSTKKVVKKVSKNEEKPKCKKTLGEKILKKLGLKKERRGRPKKRKGFTLIELLAVIVILGLLMAIAVPSVTRYITTSRKKTLTTTMGNYTSALVNEVNNLDYTFTETNTVYAIPIECIALERGGNNPLGEWSQANDKYFAYVLVQYDDENSSYRYGFTFKDSSGYGLYPTEHDELSGNEKNIRTGLSLTRPKNGKITSLTAIENWNKSGFIVNEETEMVVLEAESEGKLGDGETTCTLVQKGSNYAQVEEAKEEAKKEAERLEAMKKNYALIVENSDVNNSKPMIFVRTAEDITVNSIYNSKTYGDVKVLAVYTGFDTTSYEAGEGYSNVPWGSYGSTVTSIMVEDVMKPISTAGWFTNFTLANNIDVTNLDVSLVTDMTCMFYGVASKYGVTSFVIKGLDKWDTSKVTNMTGMFSLLGKNVTDWSITSIGKWDVSNVVTTEGMFAQAGLKSANLELDVSNWDVSSLKNMSFMFGEIGRYTSSFKLNGVEKWNTSNVESMYCSFYGAGREATYSLDLSHWNIDKVVEYSGFNDYIKGQIIAPSF